MRSSFGKDKALTVKNYTSKKDSQDNDMLSTLLTMGGVVKNSTINSVWENHLDKISIIDNVNTVDNVDGFDVVDNVNTFDNVDHVDTVGDARNRDRGERRGSARPLSTAHISPFVEYYEGGSLIKVSKALPSKPVGGGKRGVVKGFSMSSRRRLMQTIARVKRDADLPAFLTLTYPNEFPEPKKSKQHLDTFIKRLRRKFDCGGIWKLEPQERGAPHYHMLIWGVTASELSGVVPWMWFDIAGNGDQNHLLFHCGALGNQPCVTEVQSFRGVWAYAAKYLGKTFEVAGWDSKLTGRFWAVFNRHIIPFGQLKSVDITIGKAVHIMRYQKRFAKLRRRSYPSLSTFCDANQWINNVVEREVKEKK